MFEMLSPAASLLVIIQVFGVCSAIGVRRYAGTCHEQFAQFSFFAWLTLVGLSTIGSALFAASYCLICGGSFSIMVLTAIWDTRPSTPAMPLGR